ncbi:hypothetical protein J671_2285 [Acinetobacter sp. 1130196]|uniref:hypothetical protein n=1 Tax=Acinetobacter sp. 1130196 TaxID=1310772 RepID=UPI000447ADCA|nr:hypothetical protein J671_2285 [Acinetobacter sp. 1130196]
MASRHGFYGSLSFWGGFSIFEAAIKADEVAVEAEATQIRIGKLKWLVNHQHKIIKQQDQSIEELKASHHGETIGHEHHLKKVKQERDELRKQVSMNTSNKAANEGWDL